MNKPSRLQDEQRLSKSLENGPGDRVEGGVGLRQLLEHYDQDAVVGDGVEALATQLKKLTRIILLHLLTR